MTIDEAIFQLKDLHIDREDFADWDDPEDVFLQDMNAIDIAIEHLRSVPRWIPCSERLPEIGARALICAVDGCRTTARYCADGEWHLTTGGFLHDGNVVTHWMPLPEPPEMEKEYETN